MLDIQCSMKRLRSPALALADCISSALWNRRLPLFCAALRVELRFLVQLFCPFLRFLLSFLPQFPGVLFPLELSLVFAGFNLPANWRGWLFITDRSVRFRRDNDRFLFAPQFANRDCLNLASAHFFDDLRARPFVDYG